MSRFQGDASYDTLSIVAQGASSLCENIDNSHKWTSDDELTLRALAESEDLSHNRACVLCGNQETWEDSMPTNIDIDEDLILRAMRVTGLKTKKAAVEEGLRALIRLNDHREIRDLRGRLTWEDGRQDKKGKKG